MVASPAALDIVATPFWELLGSTLEWILGRLQEPLSMRLTPDRSFSPVGMEVTGRRSYSIMEEALLPSMRTVANY
jgi:hypothetical protein